MLSYVLRALFVSLSLLSRLNALNLGPHSYNVDVLNSSRSTIADHPPDTLQVSNPQRLSMTITYVHDGPPYLPHDIGDRFHELVTRWVPHLPWEVIPYGFSVGKDGTILEMKGSNTYHVAPRLVARDVFYILNRMEYDIRTHWSREGGAETARVIALVRDRGSDLVSARITVSLYP